MSSQAMSALPHVLVVDDEEPVRRIIETWLTRLGYPCSTCGDGLEALLLMDREPFGIVIMDWHMPGMNGIELVRLLRARAFAQVPYLVLTTGDLDRNAVENAFQAGADDFVRKPIDASELQARLKGAKRVLDLETKVREQVQGEALMGLHRGSVRELSEVVATLAHDLRTPLGTLRMTAEGLRAKAQSEAPGLLPGIERMCRVTEGMADTLGDVVTAFLADDGEDSNWLDHDVSAEVQRAVEMIAARLPSAGAVAVPQTRFLYRGNPFSLRRLFMNLVANSLRHGNSRTIQISLGAYGEEGEWSLLDIRDDGVGIAPELLPHLGEPLYLSAASHRKNFFVNGTGLGLVICRRIAAEHGGRIAVSSAPGKGTRVRVWLRNGMEGPVHGEALAPLETEALP